MSEEATLNPSLRKLSEMTDRLVLHDRLLDVVFEQVGEGFILCNLDGVIELVNPAAYKMFGYRAGELEGKKVESLVAPQFREAHLAGMERAKVSPRSIEFDPTLELTGVAKDGSAVHVNVSVYPIENGVGPFVLGLVRLLGGGGGEGEVEA